MEIGKLVADPDDVTNGGRHSFEENELKRRLVSGNNDVIC